MMIVFYNHQVKLLPLLAPLLICLVSCGPKAPEKPVLENPSDYLAAIKPRFTVEQVKEVAGEPTKAIYEAWDKKTEDGILWRYTKQGESISAKVIDGSDDKTYRVNSLPGDARPEEMDYEAEGHNIRVLFGTSGLVLEVRA